MEDKTLLQRVKEVLDENADALDNDEDVCDGDSPEEIRHIMEGYSEEANGKETT